VTVTDVPTSALDHQMLIDVRALLTEVFGALFTEQDWQNACGGRHALAWLGDELIGHGSVVPRQFRYGDRILRTGYVEAVAVRLRWRRQGHGAALMERIESMLRASYEFGALGSAAGAEPFYALRGWMAWEGQVSALTTSGVKNVELERELYVYLPHTESFDPAEELTCDWREGDLW
jgi:aminoglycoside 2'-N-acetyltransferase I